MFRGCSEYCVHIRPGRGLLKACCRAAEAIPRAAESSQQKLYHDEPSEVSLSVLPRWALVFVPETGWLRPGAAAG